MTDPRDDDLRALLDDAVSDVDPPPALHHIQARTRSQSSQKVVPMNSKRPWIFVAVGAVAATAATLVAVTVITDDPETTSGPAGSPSASATAEESEEPTAEPSDEATDEPSASPAGETTSVPVYYVGDSRGSVRLFREFHRLEKESVAAAQVSDALNEALTGSPLDPDYRSDWPEGTSVSGVNIDGTETSDLVWIDLTGSDLRTRPSGMSTEEATMAVQQLVHTAQAVLQERHPIEFMVDGEPVDTLLGEPVAEQAVAGDPMEVQASVWIISPQHGDTVGTTFTVEGRGAFFEANVSWQLLQDGEVVDEGFTTAEEGMTLSPYSFEVTAEPGDYELRVFDADMSGGEGNGEAEDTKEITVE